ncbi:MAG: hypothetical protein ACLUIR_08640, partial [Faecalibacterium prausnitzii]
KNRLCLWPARSASHLTERIKPAPRHQRENQLKEKTSPASGPRGAQSHLTERIKPAPRHRRANLLKEELALMQSKLPLRYSFTAKINF